MYRFGVCSRSDQFATALESGVDYVEPFVANDLIRKEGETWARFDDYPAIAAAPSFAVLFPGELKLSDPDFPRAPIEAYLTAALDAAASVGIPGAKVVLGSGGARHIPDNVDQALGKKAFSGVLRMADQLAKARGLQIVLEPLNQRETNLLNTIAECAAFLDQHEIAVPIVADLYHMMREDEPVDILSTYGHRIGHAHLADTERGAPGQGDWPIAEFLRGLKTCGYQGDVSIECNWKDFAAELPNAVSFLRNIA
ncbi:MAG: hypothetical protein ABS76_08215 [Pelagibacterium sp. SCN 64-44]|nr:MAG: hypothetical protein ABS76_08215 [Pelagibacterium sp. SCN 64-44]